MNPLTSGNTRTRLAGYRKKAADCRPDYERGKNWRYWVHPIFSILNNAHGPDGEIYTDSVDQYGRYLGHAHDVAPRVVDHRGWYVDTHESGLLMGGVAVMRSSRGKMYIPVTSSDQWDGATVYLDDAIIIAKGEPDYVHEQAIKDAARLADRRAEIDAGASREDHAQGLAEQDIEEARSEIHALNRRALALLREIKTQPKGFSPAICDALRDRVSALLADRAAQFTIINERRDNYWSAVAGY